MPPGLDPRLQALGTRLQSVRPLAAAAVLAVLCVPSAGWAQGAAPVTARPADAAPGASAQGQREIAFEADSASYNQDNSTVVASGNVILRSGDQSVRADEVSWNRGTGQVVATGNIRFVDQNGNQLFTDRLELTDQLKAGAMDNLLLVFREGGRLAAVHGMRNPDGDIELERAAYSGCQVEDEHGCPKQPSWRITAKRVYYDEQTKKIRFSGAFFELFGQRILPLPGLTVRSDNEAVSGFLVPDIGLTASNGIELSGSYYWRLAQNRDLTVTGYVYTQEVPMVSAQYRALNDKGAYQVTAYATYGERLPLSGIGTGQENLRGYFFANGKFQIDPNWSVTSSIRLATDRTFLRRYDISRDDRLRSMVKVERIDSDSYLSIAGWATQLLLVRRPQGQVPIALPEIDYRLRLMQPVLGGKVELQANTLALTRTRGQDTQRAFARAQWSLRRITKWGQEVTATALVRGDVYHSDENAKTATASYRGKEGWQARGIAIGAVDVKWPLVGAFMGGTQVFTPRVQLVASPPIRNLDIPNEDARSIDLEDSNLFALNRFPGYDRIEDGVRVTYGADWQLDFPGWRIKTTIGQSYRLSDEPALFPQGTGLTEQFSDVVGRTEVRFHDFIKFTHRFRLDKDNLAVRRNEVDAAVGTDRTYLELGYLRLNRDIDLSSEDLQDREELRAAGRVAFAKYWSVFGSAVVNLTDREEDPSFTSDGFEPLRTRLGVAYEDDCLEMGFVWRRDYVAVADAQQGNTFRLYFSLKNLGFR
ncbi:MAG: LPS assembly protein LptD [Croceibacterium sp.]